MKYFIYILQSASDKGFYIGCTSKDPTKRLKEHNSGSVRSTKSRRPLALIYQEQFDSKYEAFKREWYLKHPQGYQEKLAIIKQIKGH